MPTSLRRPALLSAVLMLAVLALGACGGGESDEDQIREVVGEFIESTDPEVCALLTEDYIEEQTDERGDEALEECEDNVKDADEVKSSEYEVIDVDIDGDDANVEAEVKDEEAVIELKKEDGDWKIDSIEAEDSSASDDDSDSAPTGGATFDRPTVPFTFSYDGKYSVEPGNEPILGIVRIDDFAEISVRKSSDTPLARDAFLPQFKSDFERQGLEVDEPTTEEHSGLDMGVLDISIPKGAKGFEAAPDELHDVAYFFEVDGKLWQMQCIAPPDREAEVREACEQALESIEPK